MLEKDSVMVQYHLCWSTKSVAELKLYFVKETLYLHKSPARFRN